MSRKAAGAATAINTAALFSCSANDNLGNRTGVIFANGASQSSSYDPVSRLTLHTNDLSGTANDLSATFSSNPASQFIQTVRTGDTYAFTQIGSGSTAYTQNGLNRQVTIGGSTATWDSKGNLTTDPTSAKTYGYSSENLLTSATGGVTLGYDPQKRLYQVAGASTTRFAYDGVNAIAEYDGSNALLRRYVFANGIDDPIVWYEGTGTTDRRFMSADERGSIISLTDSSGALIGIDRYDEYGRPQSTNLGRFQYTGQMWLSELGAYHYKARVYLPHLGIFAQTDPAGYDPSPNLYAYVGNDPVNATDPTGMVDAPPPLPMGSIDRPCPAGYYFVEGFCYATSPIIVSGRRPPPPAPGYCETNPYAPQCGGGPIGLPPPTSVAPPGTNLGGGTRPPAYDPNNNYCGPEGGTSLPNIVNGVSINDICYTHDLCYAASGTSKGTCDTNFASAIFSRINSREIIPSATPSQAYGRFMTAVTAAIIAYGIVRTYGGCCYVSK